MGVVKELLVNAEVAFSNKQYNAALNWYQKVLEVTPDDVYVLSRAGAICVSLGRFEEALTYFGRAKKLDSDNGDNAFNYGNAWFFNKDYVKAFEQYVEAEKVGCSDDVKPRLYYQMALLCSMRQDIKSALIYFKKCEESDKSGVVSLNPDLISEKLKLYMLQKDYSGAANCAAQLVAINPGAFKNYMIYFGLLMAQNHYDKAEKLLREAAQYAELTDENKFALTMQTAALLGAKGDSEGAVRVLEERRNEGGLKENQLSQLLLAQAEMYSKNEKHDEAIRIMDAMLTGEAFLPPVAETEEEAPADKLTPEELDLMRRREQEILQKKIASGEISPNLGLYAVVQRDRKGKPVRKYDRLARLFAEPASQETDGGEDAGVALGSDLPVETREKVIFILLSCYLAKNAFAEARDLAEVLKHSGNKYYSYFGLYTAAMAERKLNGPTDTAEQKYAEAIAFFRNKTFADVTDTLACIFRARLYAEQGKYEKALELSNLLADADKKAVQDYIESCKA